MVNKVSIHAPARGATERNLITAESAKFQSTHPHGVRLKVSIFPLLAYQFQSTHPHGVRQNLQNL